MLALITLLLSKSFVNYSNLLTNFTVRRSVERVDVSIEFLFQRLF